ncbi:MAG: MBL fold metallo-hydrolase [Lachnospiraceae bacterium]|nr:MBL fold metallo-hydrolase [Lachnospiraceae bacterium]
MELTFWGAAHEVTGSCHMITIAGRHFLIDCGMEQGPDIYKNQELSVNPADIDFVLLTHAHIDHSGLLPLLCKNGFTGQIYSTVATADLCSIMLKDSAHIQEFEAGWRNRKAQRADKPIYEPIYTMEDALCAIELFVPCRYDEKLQINDNVSIRFTDVGHLLGSSAIEVWLTEGEESRKIVFSGDLGNSDQPILKNPATVKGCDYLVIESTYGDRVHSEEKIDHIAELTDILRETFIRGGNVVIPSFAVGRTQEILYFIREIKERNLLPEFAGFKVYLDSPLAIESTHIFSKNKYDCFDDAALELIRQGINPLVFDGLITATTSDDSRLINEDPRPKVIISASGMCEAGRIRHHLKHNLWRHDSTILFAGYQAMGTMGRKIVEGAESVKLFGEVIHINAQIKTLVGVSGHADKNGLINWISAMEEKPAKVFVVHGDDEVTDHFSDLITDTFNIPAFAPYSGGVVNLITGEVLEIGNNVRIERIKPAQKKKRDCYERALAAAENLLDIVKHSDGLANKDLIKYETLINNLANKIQSF